MEDVVEDNAQLARDAIDLEASLNGVEASPVVTLVDRILLQAISVGASDIHAEPQKKVCGCVSGRTACFSNTSNRCPAGLFPQ